VQLIQDRFDVLITIDRGFEYEHNLKSLRFGIVIVHVHRNEVLFYNPLLTSIRHAILQVQPGQVIHVTATGDF
jgi:hypothetical protein